MYSTLSKLFLPNLFLKAQILFLLKVVKRQKSQQTNFYLQGPGRWWRGRVASASLQRGTGTPLSKQVRGFYHLQL